MKNDPKQKADIEDHEQALIFGLLSEQLSVASPAQDSLVSMENRLRSRIQASIAKHAGLRTIRFREGLWFDLISGIRYKPLWESAQGNSVLIEFAPGSALPIHRHNYLEEGIVLSGGLQLDSLDLGHFDYHVSPAGSRHGRIRSEQGALAFLRGTSLGLPMNMLKEVLGGFLPKSYKDSESIMTDQGEWIENQKGVFQKMLWTDGTVASRFCRLEAGVRLNGHEHPLDEECMMLTGEVFLGDILLQQGDHHVAPAGSKHLEIFSDTGALFFIRGAA